MKGKRTSDFNFCPICGDAPFHRACDPKVLAGIDAANTRARNENDDGVYNLFEFSLNQRLHDGYEMLSMDGTNYWEGKN